MTEELLEYAILNPTEVVYSAEMPVNQPTLPVLNERVQNAINIMRFLGIAFVAAVVGVAIYFNNKVTDHGERLAKIETQTTEIDKKVDRLLDKGAELILTSPQLAGSSAAQDVADAAKKERNIPIDSSEIARLSEPLLENVTPVKWNAVAELLNLRSYGNSTLEEAKRNVIARIRLTTDPKRVFVIPVRQPGQWVELSGSMVVLDPVTQDDYKYALWNSTFSAADKRLGNIIFSGMRIVYHGGPLTLTNIFFDNCTFDISDTASGQQLAKEILKPSPLTTFSVN